MITGLLLASALMGGPRVELVVADARIADHSDIITPACDLLRVRCVVVGDADDVPEPGQIGVLLTDWGPIQFDGGYALGVTFYGGTCNPVLWSDSDVKVLAHELGHALGLPHSKRGKERLMHPIAMGGDELSGKEKRKLRKGARKLRKC